VMELALLPWHPAHSVPFWKFDILIVKRKVCGHGDFKKIYRFHPFIWSYRIIIICSCAFI
jgi:hypothetical protein